MQYRSLARRAGVLALTLGAMAFSPAYGTPSANNTCINTSVANVHPEELRPTVLKAMAIRDGAAMPGTKGAEATSVYIAEVGFGAYTTHLVQMARYAADSLLGVTIPHAMEYSDDLYGVSNSGYVSLERLDAMLRYHTANNLEKFAYGTKGGRHLSLYAATAATSENGGRIWAGYKRQSAPGASTYDVIEAYGQTQRQDNDTWHQQQTMGVFGVNVMHASIYGRGSPKEFAGHFGDNEEFPMKIDLAKVEGPDFAAWAKGDIARANFRLALALLEVNLTPSVAVTKDGNISPSASFYGQNLFVTTLRGVADSPERILNDAGLESAFEAFFEKAPKMDKRDRPTRTYRVVEIVLSPEEVQNMSPEAEARLYATCQSLFGRGFVVAIHHGVTMRDKTIDYRPGTIEFHGS